MSATPCRNGVSCQRQDCWFTHPQGRAIGNSYGGGGGGGGGNGYGYGANTFSNDGGSYGGLVGLNNGAYIPPQQQQQQQYYQQQQYQPPQQQQQQQPQQPQARGSVCCFGRDCNREECFYVHPNGRDIDDAPPGAISAGPGARPVSSSPNNDLDEWEQQEEFAAAQEEAAALAAIQNCECCGGRPYECQNAACKDAGRCGCTMGDEDDDNEADDSWRDEWFPASRNCPCCEGSIYRCKKLQDDCVSGQCSCSLSKGQAAAAAF